MLWFCAPSCDHYKQGWYLDQRWYSASETLVSPLLLFCWLDIPEAEITTWLPSPLASAVLWRELWPPWTRGSLWLSGMNSYQLDFLSAVDSRLGSQAGHLYLCVHCHISSHNRLTLTCQDLMNSSCPLPLHPPAFPENFLPLLAHCFLQPHALWRWGHGQSVLLLQKALKLSTLRSTLSPAFYFVIPEPGIDTWVVEAL